MAACGHCRPVGPARPVPARKRARRLGVALGAAAAAAILSVGVAAAGSQGANTGGLSAGSTVAAACGTDIVAAYTTAYASSIPGYAVSQVNLAGIPAACLTRSYRIQLTGAAGAVVGSEMAGTLPSSGTTAHIAASGTPDASLVTGISVVIS